MSPRHSAENSRRGAPPARRDYYQEVTDRIIAALEAGTPPWRRPRREIFRAAADAQRIADYLLAFHPDYARRQSATPPDETLAGDGGADAPEPMSVAA